MRYGRLGSAYLLDWRSADRLESRAARAAVVGTGLRGQRVQPADSGTQHAAR